MEIPWGLYGMVDLAPRWLPGQKLPEAAAGTGSPPPAGRLASALLDGGARVLQLRMKGSSAAAMVAAVDELKIILQGWPGVRLIVNDRLDVALATGLSGVHLGQMDLPVLQARRLCPPGFCIGVSTHDEEQAERAVLHGADYIGFGPIYLTGSKVNPDPVIGVARLAALCQRLPVPVVAIGGITLDRVPEVAAAGARAAAIIAAVNLAPDVRAAAAAVTRLFAARPRSQEGSHVLA